MTLLIRYKFHIMIGAALLALLLASVRTKVNRVTEEAKDLPKINQQGQFDHALELLPPGQRLKHLSAQYNGKDLRPFILSLVQQSLPKMYKNRAFEIARSVIVEANHHDMDPMFLLAVINTESQFNLKARGSHGEIGLMQILPRTAKWLAPQAGVATDKINLEDPIVNIRIGATYFANLREKFDGHGVYYVSAYNMGPKNVRRLLASNVQPKAYSGKVLGNYKKFYTEIQKSVAATTSVASRKIASNH